MVNDVVNNLRNQLIWHWRQGGGPIAALLWWNAFLLLTTGIVWFCIRDGMSSYESRRLATSIYQLKNITLSTVMYAEDYDKRLPNTSTLPAFRHAVDNYLFGSQSSKQESLWRTPESDVHYAVNPALSYRNLTTLSRADRTILLWDRRLYRSQNHIVGLLDGRVRSVDQKEWSRLCQESGIPSDTSDGESASPWWVRLIWHPMINLLFVLALGVAIVAAGMEATDWARGRRFYPLALFGWFLVRLIGYGLLLCVLSALIGCMFLLILHSYFRSSY